MTELTPYELMIKSLTNRDKSKRKVKLVEEKLLEFAFAGGDSEEDEDFVVGENDVISDDFDSDNDSNTNRKSDSEDSISDELESSSENACMNSPSIGNGINTVPDVLTLTEHVNNDMDKSCTESVLTKKPFLVCGICLESKENDNDEILECDNCGISVHEGCYGDIGADDNDTIDSDVEVEPWFCEPCKAGVKTSPFCELCPNIGGIYKQTDSGKWVHLVCALYTPDVGFRNVSKLQTVVLEDIKSSSWAARECTLCLDDNFSKTGVCIDCDAGLCKTSFHVSCAQRNGFLSDIPDSDVNYTDDSDLLFAHCKLHSVKADVKARKTSWLAFQSHMKNFKRKQIDDEKFNSCFEKAKRDYQEYRRSVVYSTILPKLPRFLSSCPEACILLAKKAEIQGIVRHPGYNVNAAITSGRISKQDPNLSSDFVNHFFKREMLIKELQQKLKTGNPLSNNLKNEQQRLLGDTIRLQKELETVMAKKEEMNVVLKNIHKLLCQLCSKNLKMPDLFQIKDNSDIASHENSKILLNNIIKKCATCSSADDQHTLVYCSKCKNYYHMNCLDPPLLRMPNGSGKKQGKYIWQCTECDSSESDCESEAVLETTDQNGKRRTKRKVKEPEKFTPENVKEAVDIFTQRKSACNSAVTPSEKKKNKSTVIKDKNTKNSNTPCSNKKKKSDNLQEHWPNCFKCKKNGDASSLVKCDNCKRCYHFKLCLDPPYAKSPKGKFWDWVCEECDEIENGDANITS
ncbi:PHD finger protein 14 [Hydra vulgaris]|uniref:PHD finger protein 14 n=1 Tax=Hydra vulgaris TaxID=6087 RepID=UPI001F5EBF4A|nr:PHD finger protein 14 [Hydra vulgaris]